MKIKSAITCVTILVTIANASKGVYKEVEDYDPAEWVRPYFLNKWPRTAPEYYDFIVGTIVGAYLPLMGRANDNDCLSALFDFFASTNVSYYFQKKWRHSILAWVVLATISTLCIWSSVNVVTTCSA